MIRKLSKYLGEYTRTTLLTPLLIVGEVLLEVAIPFLMASLIDIGIENSDIAYVVRMGLFMVLMSLFSLVFGALAGRTSAVASAGFAKNLRKGMYYNIQNFSFSNLDKFSTASIITRLTTDVVNIQNAFQMITRLLVRAPLMLISATAMAFVTNYQLAIIFACAIPFLGFFLYFLMSRAHPYFIKMFKKYEKVNSVVQENLIGIRTVKSYVREDFENEKFKTASSDILYYSKKAEKLFAFLSPIMMVAIYGCILAISWFGGNMIISGTMSTGALTSFLTYVMQILMSLMMISMASVMIVTSKTSAMRVLEVLEEKTDIFNKESPVTEVKDGSIEFKHASFNYNIKSEDGDTVLKDINLKIESGQTVGIIGGTGSAKTTLVQLIPRLYDVADGACFVGGVDVKDYDIKTLRDNVAMVLQKNVLFSGTIAENLRWGNESATTEQLEEVCRICQAHDFITSFPLGYDTVLEQGGVNLSGGQRQRLCIARALLKNPKILIMDDSTSAVDTKTDASIRSGLNQVKSDITKIIIAQRISSIQDCDMIAVMNDGKILATGTHEELYHSNEIYREVYSSQTGEGDGEKL